MVLEAPALSRAVLSDGVTVARVDPQSEVAVRSLAETRIASLESDGQALLGDLAVERGRSAAEWRRVAEDDVWFLASEGGHPVGIAKIHEAVREDPPHHLESMWVRPTKRRRGIGNALVLAAEQYLADTCKVERVALWVVASNPEAEKLYLARGYEPTLRSGFLPDGRPEVEYAKSLAEAHAAGSERPAS